jgi:tetratricopeptide (TPR) repeat protein
MSRLAAVAVAVALVCARAWAGPIEEAEAEMRRAKANLDRGEYEAAIGHYIQARALAPDSSGPYLGLGLAYAGLGRCGEAIPLLEEYLRRKKKDPFPGAAATLNACRARNAQTASGRVTVTSDPQGAEVRLDDVEGDLLGRTPCEVSLPPGEHILHLSLGGYQSVDRTVVVNSGAPARTHATLQPKLPAFRVERGHLELTIKPEAANLTVNGLPVGQKKLYQADLPASVYEVIAERAGYESERRSYLVEANRTTRDEIKMVSSAPGERRRKAGIAVGVIVAVGVVAAAIALGVVYGVKPEVQFSTVPIR